MAACPRQLEEMVVLMLAHRRGGRGVPLRGSRRTRGSRDGGDGGGGHVGRVEDQDIHLPFPERGAQVPL